MTLKLASNSGFKEEVEGNINTNVTFFKELGIVTKASILFTAILRYQKPLFCLLNFFKGNLAVSPFIIGMLDQALVNST